MPFAFMPPKVCNPNIFLVHILTCCNKDILCKENICLLLELQMTIEKLLSCVSIVTAFHDWFLSFIPLQNGMYRACRTALYNVTGTFFITGTSCLLDLWFTDQQHLMHGAGSAGRTILLCSELEKCVLGALCFSVLFLAEIVTWENYWYIHKC